MLIDSVLGILKALSVGRVFSFRTLYWGVIAKASILLIPLIIALTAKGVGLDFTVVVHTVISIMVVSECISCVTNVISVRTKKEVDNSDYITLLLNSIKKIMTSLAQKLLSGIEGEQPKDKTE